MAVSKILHYFTQKCQNRNPPQMLLEKMFYRSEFFSSSTMYCIFFSYSWVSTKHFRLTFDDTNPSWVNSSGSNETELKNSLLNEFAKNDQLVRTTKTENLIHGSKLNNLESSAKTYWSLLKLLQSGKINLLIPSLLIKDQFEDLKNHKSTRRV